MKLKKLALHKLPGLQRSFELDDLSPGLNVIIGPNASGKTSICQAIRRLLWPNSVKHLLHAEIYSEWSHNQECFTIAVKDGQLAPQVSQSGQCLLNRLPEEAILFCFSITIDELFDGKDLDFAQRIAREIAGGCDLKLAQNDLTPAVSPRAALKEWETASTLFNQYKQKQELLRLERSQLPDLERLIREAEEAREHVSILDKILALKNLKEKMSACEQELNTFSKQLLESKIQATDWAEYEQLIERRKRFESVSTPETSIRFVGWTVTVLMFVLAGIPLFLCTHWMKVFAFSVFIPLGYLWKWIFRSEKRHLEKIAQEKHDDDALEQKLKLLLARTECLEHPDHLRLFVDQLPHYQQLKNNLMSLKRQFEESVALLEERHVARISENKEILTLEKNAEEAKGTTLRELSERKGSLTSRLQEVDGMKGEELLRDQEEKLTLLRQACRDMARKELLQSLVLEVQREFQRDCQPPILERAADWFCRFTKSKFCLEAPSTQAGTVVYEVIDTSTGERKNLDRLSRGTRMQLLLSVRLSFALQSNEKHISPPIFLDEVLANTDPERFDEVAKVISELSASGKQIFYLTCNPEDAWKWKTRCPNAHLIDLAKIRGGQPFLVAPLPIVREKLPNKPSHRNFFAFVQELKLPTLQIDEPLETLSVHYLVDQVDDLYRLLESGIETYGNLMHLRADLIEQGFPKSASLIRRRRQLLERFFDLKRRGRGKLVSRAVLMEGGLSKIFIDRIWEIAQGLGGNAKKLVEFLEDKSKKDERKKGLRGEDREELKGYLSRHGYLDERPILTDDEIRCELLPLTIEEQDRLFMEQLFT
jgi:energy-coupling factor transporter ATP-binding protein EcfA2